MATSIIEYRPTHPGLEQGAAVSDKMHFSASEGQYGFQAANQLSAMEGKINFGGFGGYQTFVPAQWTTTLDTPAGASINYGAGGGVVITAATVPVTNDEDNITSLQTVLTSQGKVFSFMTRIQTGNSSMGVSVGLVTSSAVHIVSALPADGVYFNRPNSSSTITAKVIENSNASNDLALFNLANGVNGVLSAPALTDVVIGAKFMSGATAALSWGEWWANGIRTPFTAAQVTAIFNLVNTTPATLAFLIGGKILGTTQRTATVSWAYAEADR